MPIDVERDDVRRLMNEGARVVEVLPEQEYSLQHLAGAISLPLKKLNRATAAQLSRNAPVVVYCNDAT